MKCMNSRHNQAGVVPGYTNNILLYTGFPRPDGHQIRVTSYSIMYCSHQPTAQTRKVKSKVVQPPVTSYESAAKTQKPPVTQQVLMRCNP